MSNAYIARPVGPLATLFVLGLLAAMPGTAQAQLFRRCQPCVTCPAGPAAGQPGAPGAQPGGEAQPAPGAEPGPAADLFAQTGAGAAGGPQSAAPSMIGDFFGGGLISIVVPSDITTQMQLVPLPGATVPRFKMA
jgi:hypothetical protein